MTRGMLDVAFGIAAALATTAAGSLGLTPYAVFGAYAGVFASVFILSRKDAALLTRAAPGGRYSRAGWIVGATSAWAICSAWVVSVTIHLLPLLQGAPEVPLYGLGGLSAQIVVPRLLRAAKKRTDRLGDDPRA